MTPAFAVGVQASACLILIKCIRTQRRVRHPANNFMDAAGHVFFIENNYSVVYNSNVVVSDSVELYTVMKVKRYLRETRKADTFFCNYSCHFPCCRRHP
jgi:hypothetical protein